MAEKEELEALKGEIGPAAIDQLDAVNSMVPAGAAREPNSGIADVVFLRCLGQNMIGGSNTGQAAPLSFKETTPFARLEIGGKTRFCSMDDQGGSHRFLRGLTSSQFGQIDLVESISEPETGWNVSEVIGG